MRLQYSRFFRYLLRKSLTYSWAMCVSVCVSLCPPQAAWGDGQPEVLFTLTGEEISKETSERAFSPLKSFVRWAETKVLDVDEKVLVNDIAAGEEHLLESKARAVLSSGGNKLYFIRAMEVDEKKAEQKRQRVAVAEALLRIDRAMSGEESVKLHSQLRGERWETGNSPGAAFIKAVDRCLLRRLDRDELESVPPIAAYRAVNYKDYRWAPVRSAADFVLGSGVIDSLSHLMISPARVDVFEDGSHRITWKLANGRVEREVYFSADHDLLPVSMVNFAVSNGTERKEFSSNKHKWERVGGQQWVLDQYEASYRSPLAKPARQGLYLAVSLNFTWSERGHDSVYFDERFLGHSVPFEGVMDSQGNGK